MEVANLATGNLAVSANKMHKRTRVSFQAGKAGVAPCPRRLA